MLTKLRSSSKTEFILFRSRSKTLTFAPFLSFLEREQSRVWGLFDNVACHYTITLQKYALRLIIFSTPRSPSNPIFSNHRILKFFDLVEILNILFVHQLFNIDIPEDTPLILAKSVIHFIQGDHAWAFILNFQSKSTLKLMVFTLH